MVCDGFQVGGMFPPTSALAARTHPDSNSHPCRLSLLPQFKVLSGVRAGPPIKSPPQNSEGFFFLDVCSRQSGRGGEI